MTGKEKIELKDGVINIFNKFNTLDNTATIGGLRDDILRYIDSLQEELVSEDLEKAAEEWDESLYRSDAFKAGSKWQKEHLWKSANGDDLPEIDREVIALLNNGKVVFAHRPNPKGFDGKSFTTGEVEHYTPKTYDKGGWNIPDIV